MGVDFSKPASPHWFDENALPQWIVDEALDALLYHLPADQPSWYDDIINHPEREVIFPNILDGYELKMCRGQTLAWNAYITLPVNHPCIQMDSDQIEDLGIHPHGGITAHSDRTIGYDHSHWNDIVPLGGCGDNNPHYWTFEEVRDGLLRVHQQFIQIAREANIV